MEVETTRIQSEFVGVSSVEREQLRLLYQRSNLCGLKRLSAHLVLVVTAAVGVHQTESIQLYVPAAFVLGVVGIFLFAPLHECIHRTAFRSRWLNDAVARVAGFLLLLPPRYFRSFHLSHHRHTQVSERDPELAGKDVSKLGRYLIYASGLLYWRDGILILIRHALGQVTAPYIGRAVSQSIINEARCYLFIYVVLAVLSAIFQTTMLVTFWLVPAVLGQPVLRLYLLAEHTLCPLIPDMLRNSRTTLTMLPVRFIAWNMPYHAEHHALMAIPFHALPRAHMLFRDRIDYLTPGYSKFHGQLLAAIRHENA